MPAWIDEYEKRAERMNNRFDSDDEYFEAGEDLGVALEMVTKLIAAVEAAEKNLGWIKEWMMEQEHDLSIWDREIYDKVLEALAQLQSGEFPVTSNE